MFDFASDLANLALPVAPKRNNGAKVCDETKFPKLPIPPEGIESLGLEREALPPLAWEPLLDEGGCPHLLDTIATEGAHQAQPLWNLNVLMATFLKNGHYLAHKMSKGYPGYTVEETEVMWERKKRDREERGLGWPSCAAIESAGCKSCAACPHKGKIRSPLNLTSPVVPPNQKKVVGQTKQNEIINYYPGNEAVCRTALDKIVAADQATFTSGDILVILRVPDQKQPGLERWSGDLPGTTPALPADIIERAENLSWMTRTGGKGGQRWNRSKPPRDFCTDYITQRRGRYGARPLVGIARVPHMRDDGSVRTETGYDPETGIFVDRAPKLTIPESPTLEDAKAALQRVLKPFEYYKFEDRENGLLQVFAANVTALERPYMKTAPAVAVNGVQSGTGKGYLCRAIGHQALGTTPPFMAWGHDDDEFTKRLDTMLLVSPAMLVIDNCNNRLLRGDTLEMAISEGQATIRLFTKLEGRTVQNRTFIMANGNNIQISGDMSRRSIRISILPRSASPERDTFPFTPENYVIEHRVSLLNDYYTIMRAYRLAGMPLSGLPAVGSFPEWERKVRDPVWWLTGYDLSEEFDKNKKDDPEQQNDAALLAALRDYFGEKWFKASEADAALKRATEHRRYGGTPVQQLEAGAGNKAFAENKPQLEQAAHAAKEDAILEAAEQKFGSKLDYAKPLGNWARGIQNKFIDGFILRRQEDTHTKIHLIKVALAKSTNEGG